MVNLEEARKELLLSYYGLQDNPFTAETSVAEGGCFTASAFNTKAYGEEPLPVPASQLPEPPEKANPGRLWTAPGAHCIENMHRKVD